MVRIVEFGLEIGLGGAAHAGALRAAALRHEAGDHAVELDAIIKAFADQFLDPLDMAGGQIGPQLDHNIAAIERENQFFVRHRRQIPCLDAPAYNPLPVKVYL